jgi:hypothetical protein
VIWKSNVSFNWLFDFFKNSTTPTFVTKFFFKIYFLAEFWLMNHFFRYSITRSSNWTWVFIETWSLNFQFVNISSEKHFWFVLDILFVSLFFLCISSKLHRWMRIDECIEFVFPIVLESGQRSNHRSTLFHLYWLFLS